MQLKLLFINGSVRGAQGNSARLLEHARAGLPADVHSEVITLTEYQGSVEQLATSLRTAHALCFGTGTYWGSWGSPLQRFLEVTTSYELSDCFFGKPVAVLVSADSVGGMEIAQRLHGALNFFGCLSPPLSSVVVSRAGAALRTDPAFEDVFQIDDARVALTNLVLAARQASPRWERWAIARLDGLSGPYPHSGPLYAALPRFVDGSGHPG